MTKTPLVLDSTYEFLDAAGDAAIKHSQEIDPALLDYIKDVKHAQHNRREGEFMLAASIPVVIHEKWLREGYDCTREPIQKTLQRLRAQGLDGFIATDKRI